MDPRITSILGGVIGAAAPPEERAFQIVLGMGIGYFGPVALALSNELREVAPVFRRNIVRFVSASTASFLWNAATHSPSGVYLIFLAAGAHTLLDIYQSATQAPVIILNQPPPAANPGVINRPLENNNLPVLH